MAALAIILGSSFLVFVSSLAWAAAFGFSFGAYAGAVAGLFFPRTSPFLGAASEAPNFFLYSRISRSYLSFSV